MPIYGHVAHEGLTVLLVVQNYCMSVYLVRHLTSTDLLLRLKQNGIRHSDHTRALSQFSLSLLYFSVGCWCLVASLVGLVLQATEAECLRNDAFCVQLPGGKFVSLCREIISLLTVILLPL